MSKRKKREALPRLRSFDYFGKKRLVGCYSRRW